MNLLNKKPVFFVLVASIFFVILLFVFRGFVFNPDTLMLNSDQLNGIGSRILRAENVILTEWDDSRLGGVPTIDALFADAYHPLVWVQFLTNPARAVGFKFILTIWVAFMSAMLLGWNLTQNKWWGALLGFLYAFSPAYFSYIYGGHDGKMMVFAIAPLALLSIRKIVREGSLPYLIVLALSITWMILGSHLQLTYLFLWGAGFYTLYEAIFHSKGIKSTSKRFSFTVLGLIFGLAISCFQVIPPYIYTTTQSVRGEGEHTNYGHAASWSLHQEELAQMLIPGFVGVDVFEQNEKTGVLEGSSFINATIQEYQNAGGSPFYWGHNSFKLDHNSAGILLTFLGFLCLFIPEKRRWALFWGLGAILALSYGMGAHSPLFKLWYNILPGVKNFRAPGMSMFWLPLLLVMMSAPVLKVISSGDNSKIKYLFHGAILFAILLLIVVIARFNWISFIGPIGFIMCVLYSIACLGVMSLDDGNKSFSFENYINAYKSGLPNTSRIVQIGFVTGFTFVGVFLMSGQNLLNDPIYAPYFKPLNEIAMNMASSKIIPSFMLAIGTILVSLFVIRLKINIPQKSLILAIVASIDLFFINGAFVQNVKANEYLQPTNPVIQAIKTTYQKDSINTPRVLSLSRNKALGANAFPQYHLRNADGFHDNELASYRAFRGGQNNANYLLNINNPELPHPFLDLMNIGYIIFDSPRGTTYMPIPTAMGEAYLYGETIVLNDDEAIKLLQNKASIRKNSEPTLTESPNEEQNNSTNTSDLEKEPSEKEIFANVSGNDTKIDDNFYYREKVILAEAPSQKYQNGLINGYAKLIEQPKMDTQIFQVETDKPAVMVVAGNYHPYWKAYINGVETKVLKAFGTLRAIEVPAGNSIVRMEYRSKPFHTCIKISLISLGLLIIISVSYFIKSKLFHSR